MSLRDTLLQGPIAEHRRLGHVGDASHQRQGTGRPDAGAICGRGGVTGQCGSVTGRQRVLRTQAQGRQAARNFSPRILCLQEIFG
jgi:hypothetical protein